MAKGFSPNCSNSSTRPTGTDTGPKHGAPESSGHGKNVSKVNLKNLKVIKKSNKPIQALNLPVIANVNPRSVYNKINEFHTFVEQEEVDVIFMSESWERENKTLQELIKLDDHTILSNVYQWKGKGGRPALIVNTRKVDV